MFAHKKKVSFKTIKDHIVKCIHIQCYNFRKEQNQIKFKERAKKLNVNHVIYSHQNYINRREIGRKFSSIFTIQFFRSHLHTHNMLLFFNVQLKWKNNQFE